MSHIPAAAPEEPMITIEAAARLLEISVERIRQLIKAGYVPRSAPGKTTLVGAVRGYIRFLTDEDRRSTRSAADSRVRDARALEIETRVAVRRSELVRRDEAEATLAFVVEVTGAELDSVPLRLTRDSATRRRHSIEIAQVKRRIGNALALANEHLATGQTLPGAESD